MLDKFGFDEENLDVTVRSDLKVEGRLGNGRYVWVIKFVVKFGKKLRDQYRIQGRLLEDKDVTIEKIAEIEPDSIFNDQKSFKIFVCMKCKNCTQK